MSDTHKLAWAAGFIDGDGFVTIQERNSTVNGKRYRGFYLLLGVNHVAPAPLYELQKLFGGNVVHVKLKKNYDGFNRKDRYTWKVNCQQAREALLQLMPYLVNKIEVAQLGIDFQNTFTGKVYKVSDELHEHRRNFKIKIMELNSLD